MIYGDEGDRNLSRLIRFVARTPLIPLPGGGRALVQPVHVEDVATAAADALEGELSVRQAYDLPGGAADPLRDLVAFVRTEVGSRAPIVALPIRPLAAASAVWTSLGLPPRIRREQVLRMDEDRAFSADPARRDFGFAPRGWREGLRDEARRLREIGWIR
jgi:nucleoside-diphosphate-sugar epimerase